MFVSVLNISSVIIAPEGEITNLLCRGPRISIIFLSPLFSAPSSNLLPKKRAPQRLPSASLDFAALDPSPPAFNRGYENQAACSLFIFSELLCVLPAARAMAFPSTGHRSELGVHQELMREVHESAAKLSLCKELKVEALPRFMVLVFKVPVIELRTCFPCCSEAGTSCRIQYSSGHRGFQRA